MYILTPMADCNVYLFYLFILINISVSFTFDDEEGTFEMYIPYIRSKFPEIHFCTGIKVDPDKNYYLVGFEPKATSDKVHHVTLAACHDLPTEDPLWYCSSLKRNISIVDEVYKIVPPCKNAEILYVWTSNAPTLRLPPGVGLKVGGDTANRYIVMQVHFPSNAHIKDVTYKTGVVIHYTQKKLTKLGAITGLNSAKTGIVPPLSEARWEISCPFLMNETIYPYFFRVHTHKLGTAVTGYRVRKNSNGKYQWTLIGRTSPQKPQAWYPVANNISITKGDILAARCTFYNYNNFTVKDGMLSSDESCIFYFSYYAEGHEDQPLHVDTCGRSSPTYSWSSDLGNIPDDASDPE